MRPSTGASLLQHTPSIRHIIWDARQVQEPDQKTSTAVFSIQLLNWSGTVPLTSSWSAGGNAGCSISSFKHLAFSSSVHLLSSVGEIQGDWGTLQGDKRLQHPRNLGLQENKLYNLFFCQTKILYTMMKAALVSVIIFIVLLL